MIAVTPRQLELLALYASGKTITEIATIKFLSVPAVEKNFASAKERTGAKSLTNLCVMCLDAGMLVKNGIGFVPVCDPEIMGE